MAEQGNGWRPRPLRAALLAGAAALPVAGIATGVLALPAVAAVCLAGAVLLPRGRERGREDGLRAAVDGEASSSASEFDELDVPTAAKSLMEALQGRVAPEVLEQVGRICQLVVVGLQTRSGDPAAASDPAMYRLRQTVLSYLPGALDAYLAVPGIYATRRIGLRKSPRETLDRQLALMEDACRRLTEGAVSEETDRLEAHGRFLEATLGASALRVDAPAGAKAPAAEVAELTADAERTRERAR